ncbi:GyrI-like domain-containing protein [Methylocella sp. CPCC 101449]|uniref:GyrI-like domain-containing protein n=1 Tax=Methylocella sp. CPCC 101449 TaxID=2987531 RepID=UPI0028919A01|nr:GyrI-like domain-containing protein [Methylocella sp. CPCC 101449]MDT2020720.1 GyrI-like domain-containing protein [Methylocella sp. CPCC 101449]
MNVPMPRPLFRLPHSHFGLAVAALLLLAAPVAAQTPTPAPPASPAAPATPSPPSASPPADQATPAPAPVPPAPSAEAEKPSGDASSVKPIEMTARPALTFSGKADWDDGYKTIMEAIAKLRAEAKRAGLKVSGYPLTVFRSTDDVGFRFDAMLVIDQPPADPQLGTDFKIMQTPAGKAVKFEHRSSYEEIESTYEAITAWLDEKGLDSRDLFIEEYLNEGKGSDDTDLQVDIYVFVK